MSAKNFKTLPVADLEVVSVIFVYRTQDATGQTAGGSDYTEAEMDEINPTLRAAAKFSDDPVLRCDCCGQRLKYACEVVHKPTLTGYFVGRSCASKLDVLRRFGGQIERSSVAVAERAACNEREKAFRAKYAADADVLAALDWAKGDKVPAIAADLVAKLRRFGDPSPAQVNLLKNLLAQSNQKTAQAASNAKAGIGFSDARARLEGKVVSLKRHDEPARYGGTITTYKVLLDLGNGMKVFGTLPEALHPAAGPWMGEAAVAAGVAVGDRITIVAAVKPSERDPLFGFFSRPTKPAKIAPSPAVPTLP